VLTLSPFAPHLGEELWHRLGHAESLAYAPWPAYDPALLVEDTVTVAVQVNGKLRATLELPRGAEQADVQAAALADERVSRYVNWRHRAQGHPREGQAPEPGGRRQLTPRALRAARRGSGNPRTGSGVTSDARGRRPRTRRNHAPPLSGPADRRPAAHAEPGRHVTHQLHDPAPCRDGGDRSGRPGTPRWASSWSSPGTRTTRRMPGS
jgi:hypothetical protein